MNCKNCNQKIRKIDMFCPRCGGKIIKERISTKSLSVDFISSLGWDSNFLKTIRFLFFKPDLVIAEYIGGTRNKYTNPFALYALTTALYLFLITLYSDKLFQISKLQEMDMFSTEYLDFVKNMQNFQFKYFTIISFIFLPICSFLTYIVFKKPFNFGEHLIINTYIGCITSLIWIISLPLGVSGKIDFGLFTLIITLIYYCFTYQRLNNYSLGSFLIKALKFIVAYLIVYIMYSSIPLIAVGGELYK